MAKNKKIDKEFLLTDESVNVYGFRLLTSGYLIDEFKKNPIGYHMHERNNGVVVRWEDLRVADGAVYGKPVINLSNQRGQQTFDEVADGFLNGASVGHIVALEYSDDPVLMLPGQTGPTVTKWYNRECSLVDVPGNMNSLALFDSEGKAINLADFKPQSIMTKNFITPEQLIAKLNLKADTTADALETALNDLVAKAAKVDDLQAQLVTAQNDKTNAETALENLKTSTVKAQVKSILEAGVASKKLTVELSAKLEKQFAEKPDELKDLVDAMPAYQPITSQLKDDTNTDAFKGDWDALDREGKLEDLKAKNIELFKEKFKAKFNKEYQG